MPKRETVRRRSWPWAVAVLAVVGVIVLSAVVAHALADRARHAQASVAAPDLPMLSVAAVAHPEAGALLVTYDPSTRHLVTLASQHEPSCPPVGSCQPAHPDALVLLDGTNGQPGARTALSGDASAATDATLLLDDPVRQRAYAIAPDAITMFSTANARLVGHYQLSSGATWSGGALDAARGHLYLLGGGRVIALDALTGAMLASVSLSVPDGAPAPDGPIFDASRYLLVTVIRPRDASDAPRLVLLDAATLQQKRALALPLGARLGPLDGATGLLDIFGGDSRAWQLHIGAAITAPLTLALTRAPALDGALAVGSNTTLRHIYVAGFAKTLLLDERNGRKLAALPLAARWPMSQPLPVDSAHGLLYLPADHGAIVVVRGGASITSESAAILARAALAKLLPDTNQDPPFVAPDTFPLGAGPPAKPETRTLEYWIHFSDRGWQGGYPGTASVTVEPESGQPGGYRVTFTITWQQLFRRTHTWVCAVAPNGQVTLLSEAGDTVP
ncbi:MAG TPA: hypothetical protein VF040_02465 [Ktedonobacterales bacterium]